MNVLIVGGAGLIGAAITRELLARGATVTHYNRGRRAAAPPDGVRRIAGAGPFDCVLDMICFTPEEAESAVRAFRGRAGQVIFCSTADVYRKPAGRYPVREDEPRDADSPFTYAADKARCEAVFAAAHARGDFPATTIRPAQTYGEGGRGRFVPSRLCGANRAPPPPPPGSSGPTSGRANEARAMTPSPDAPHDAARQFFTAPFDFLPLGDSPGFSGSHFVRVEACGAAWCLRHWPDGFAGGRLRAIHHVLRHSRARGFTGVPALAVTAAGETVVRRDGALFDAQGWLPGLPAGGGPAWPSSPPRGSRRPPPAGPVPNGVQPLPPAQLIALATALARFHRSTDDLVATDGAAGLPVAPLAEQFAALAASEGPDAASLEAGVSRAGGEEGRIARRWLALLPRAVALAGEVLRARPEAANAAAAICHRDLWAPHVFFDGPAFSGFVDFEGLAFSSPALDLAQLVLHFGGWAAREPAIRAYEREAPLEPDDRAVLPAAAILDLAGEADWSLATLYGDDSAQTSTPPAGAAHRTNLRRLLRSLESIVAELEPGVTR